MSLRFWVWALVLSLPTIIYLAGAGIGLIRDSHGGLFTAVAIAQGVIYGIAAIVFAIVRGGSSDAASNPADIVTVIEGGLIIVGAIAALVGWLVS